MDINSLIAQLRQTNLNARPINAPNQSIPTGGGVIGSPSQFGGGGLMDATQSNNQQQANPTSSMLDAAKMYNNASGGKLTNAFGLGGGGGVTAAAGSAAMPAMAAGGGSSLGSMGLMSSAAPVSFPGAATASGGGAAGGGAMGAGGWLAGLAALSYLGDKEMNESKGSIINADKLNDMGSYKGIGFRGGDLVNGFNPATWVSDPKKAAKGLGNFFTLGFLDKII